MEASKNISLAKFSILLLLSKQPRHGYELMQELENLLGKDVSASSVYPFLGQLKKQGLLIIKEQGKREKKTYALTVEGKRFVRGLTISFDDILEAAVSRNITTCVHCGCRIYGKAYTRRIQGKTLHFCCESCADAQVST